MRKLQAAEEVVEDEDEMGLGEVAAFASLDEAFEVGLDVLHHDEDVLLLAIFLT